MRSFLMKMMDKINVYLLLPSSNTGKLYVVFMCAVCECLVWQTSLIRNNSIIGSTIMMIYYLLRRPRLHHRRLATMN